MAGGNRYGEIKGALAVNEANPGTLPIELI